jgi:hypothetical protein
MNQNSCSGSIGSSSSSSSSGGSSSGSSKKREYPYMKAAHPGPQNMQSALGVAADTTGDMQSRQWHTCCSSEGCPGGSCSILSIQTTLNPANATTECHSRKVRALAQRHCL